MFSRRLSPIRLYGSLLCFSISLTLLLSLFDDPLHELTLLSPYLNRPQEEATATFPDDQADAEQDPPPSEPPYAALIIAGQDSTELNWTSLVEIDFSLYAYNVDDLNNTDKRLQLPANKGREAMVYLSWIVDNYDDLPWAGVFVHGHAESWHQPDPIARLILGLNKMSLARAGYVSLRCYWAPSCPAEIRPIHHDPVVWGAFVNEEATERAIAGNWKQLFPHERLPETIASPCCAQFAVTRQAIRQRPKEDYERLRNWLIESLLPDEFSGRVLEKLWAYLFTGNAVHCPPPKECMCEYFTDQCDAFRPEQPPEGVVIPDWQLRADSFANQ